MKKSKRKKRIEVIIRCVKGISPISHCRETKDYSMSNYLKFKNHICIDIQSVRRVGRKTRIITEISDMITGKRLYHNIKGVKENNKHKIQINKFL